MTVHWQFLSAEEKHRLEEYDLQISRLIGRRGKKYEEKIKLLHRRMDSFIIELSEKYCSKQCNCFKSITPPALKLADIVQTDDQSK